MYKYTEEQIEELKRLRLLYISKMIHPDNYDIEIEKINIAAKKAA